LGYFNGSFQVIVDALVDACEAAGVRLFRSGLSRISQGEGSTWVAHDESDSTSTHVDVMLATVPSHIFQKLAPALPPSYVAKLDALVYEAAVVAILELDRPLSDVYWLNIADDDLPFTAVIEHTNFVSAEKYQGKHFVYLSKYMEPDHPWFTKRSDEVIAAYLPHLTKINPAFESSWIQNWWVFRERAAQPITPMQYSERMPEHRTPLKNLYLANTTQIYPEDRGTNYSVRLGNDIARMIIGALGEESGEAP
jgi:protoporphyrinogen oxidase